MILSIILLIIHVYQQKLLISYTKFTNIFILIQLISRNLLYLILKESMNQTSITVMIYISVTEPNRCIGMTDSILNPGWMIQNPNLIPKNEPNTT